jgi:hypothetical protein
VIDIAAIGSVLSRATGTGWAAAYRQDVGSLLDALEAAHAEVEHLRATVAALRASVPPTHPSDYGHEAWSASLVEAKKEGARSAVAKRAAVVAYLRSVAFLVEFQQTQTLGRLMSDIAADAIERGEHRREEEK